ncbi:hypothetical protein [Shimazuella kribbensis]|uniref:hypothetical protein n=1 Tax=Shimazuella kribbensis TaxID=139808 RepID=UPI0003FD52E8|nr:hypothetical protein [Shimazuella kribbensis]
MPPNVSIISPVMSNQERLQKWKEINRMICQIWNRIEDDQKLCIIHNYNTDNEGQKSENGNQLSMQEIKRRFRY